MRITRDTARELIRRRDETFAAQDIGGYLALWSEDARVEGPEHLLIGKQELRDAVLAAWAVMRPLHMETRSLAVGDDALLYESIIVWENRTSGERSVFTAMTAHGVDADGHFTWCREYFDPAGVQRASAAELPDVAAALRADSS